MADPLFISETPEVRRLARSVVTPDFTDAQIVKQQKAAYSDIIIQTSKSNWFETGPEADNRFYKIQKIEQQLAAAYVLEYYGQGTIGEMNTIAALRADANASLTKTVESGTDVESDISISVTASDYESYPASLQDLTLVLPFWSASMPYRSTTVMI
jgi:hypothetical protein